MTINYLSFAPFNGSKVTTTGNPLFMVPDNALLFPQTNNNRLYIYNKTWSTKQAILKIAFSMNG